MKETNRRYKKMLWDIYNLPEFMCKPRGLNIKEKINHSFKIGMEDPIITIPERKLSYSFMFGEAAWMLSGRNDVASISKYVDGVKRFSDDGVTFFGAYGPKIITQTSYIIDTLIKDNDSRQAVINIWRENPRSSKDIPCTLSLQFLLRKTNEELWLHTIATMRSNDAWLGTPYDTFNFSAISFYIICWLNFHGLECKLGELNIQAGSRHIYENDFKKLDDIFTSHYHDESEISFNSLIDKYKDSPKKFISNLREAADYTPVSKDKERLQKIDFIKHG